MKITIKPEPKKENHEIPFDKIPVGYVYEVLVNGPTMLKLKKNEAVLLNYSSGDNWFKIADGHKGIPAYKILGKLTEIIVEEK